MEHQTTSILHASSVIYESRPSRKRNLTVRVDMSEKEVEYIFNSSLVRVREKNRAHRYDFYKIYLRHLFPKNPALPFETMMAKLNNLRARVQYRINFQIHAEQMAVNRVLLINDYMSKTTKRNGLVVKLFRTMYEGREVIIKTYVYDHAYKSLAYSAEQNFENEVVFQLYANQLSGVDYISPELYSWGAIGKQQITPDGYKYKCLYLIMEYIPYLTLKEALFTPENMKIIYERVRKIDTEMKASLLHHNDLHSRNILVSTKSPSPEIVILDFGEASFGPKKPLYK